MIDPYYTTAMNDQQRALFYAEYARVRKDEVVGVLFALFLGGLGFHRFYLRETGWGILYLVFAWTGIPAIVGVIECFFMPGRVRGYNSGMAQRIAAGIGVAPGVYGVATGRRDACGACGRVSDYGAVFCPGCGGGMAHPA